jgi:DNA replication protein DnaC
VARAVRLVKDSWSKDSDRSESEAIELLTAPDLLILDEVGIQSGSDFEKNLIFDVLNERYARRRPVILLSNLEPKEISAFLGERVMDRLREDGATVHAFTWSSHRGVSA